MMRQLGHMDCGIYAEVVGDGRIATGDAIVESEPALI
jgi:MOSC domain-containing protein YiiM